MLNYNGDLLISSEVTITPDNRGFKYGDSIFEVVKISDGRVVFWEDHYFQLMASMRMLRMKIPMRFTLEYLEQEILKTIQKCDKKTALIARISLTRKDGGSYRPKSNEIDYLIEIHEMNASTKLPYTVDLYKDFYVYSGHLSTVNSNNKLPLVLASIYAEDNELDNCILLNERKGIVQATDGNIFLIKDKHIKTPALTEGCLKGITREKTKKIIASNAADFTFEETFISPFELQKADEVFITNPVVGIQPVSAYRKKKFCTTISTRLSTSLRALERI